MTHSLVWNNSSTNPNGGGDSGGIQNYGDHTVGAGKLSIDNSTIADNTSPLGGGIFSWCAGTGGECSATGATNTTTITNSTIAYNNGGTRGATGGGLLASQGTISVPNSILASNTVDQSADRRADRRPTAALESGRDHLARLQHRDGRRLRLHVHRRSPEHDPGLPDRRPAFNGGNTETFALAATSPAVDAIPTSGPGARAPISATSPGRRAPAATSAPTSCSSRSRASQFTDCRRPGRREHRRRSVGVTAPRRRPARSMRSDGSPERTPTRRRASTTRRSTGRTATARSQTTPFDVKVHDAPLTASRSTSARRGAPFSGQVARSPTPTRRHASPTTRRRSPGATGRARRDRRPPAPAAVRRHRHPHLHAAGSSRHRDHRRGRRNATAPTGPPVSPPAAHGDPCQPDGRPGGRRHHRDDLRHQPHRRDRGQVRHRRRHASPSTGRPRSPRPPPRHRAPST